MTWAKLSDGFNVDPVLTALPRGERLLYVELTVWSCGQGTDGQVPAHIPARVSDEPDIPAALASLERAELIERTESGWLLLRFADEQISADEDRRRKRVTRDRQERWRRHQNGDHGEWCPTTCARRNASRNASHNALRDALVTGVDQPVPPVPPVLPDPSGLGRQDRPVTEDDPSHPGAPADAGAGSPGDENEPADSPLAPMPPGLFVSKRAERAAKRAAEQAAELEAERHRRAEQERLLVESARILAAAEAEAEGTE